MTEYKVEALGIDDMRQVQARIDPSVIAWANTHPVVTESNEPRLPVQALAAMYAVSKALAARSRLSSFQSVTRLWPGVNMHAERRDLSLNNSPKEMAGKAAGQLAIARTIVGWYELGAEDLARVATLEGAFVPEVMDLDGADEQTGSLPQELGITSFSTRNVYLAVRSEAEYAVGYQGPPALTPYMDFPQFPITAQNQ